MNPYIVNLTNNLIGRHHYDEIFNRTEDLEDFVRHVKTDLEANDVGVMSPPKLGEIMCSFEIGDVMVSKAGLFSSVHFSGNCEELLRELVSLCLAYAIRDRLDNRCSAVVPQWQRRR